VTAAETSIRAAVAESNRAGADHKRYESLVTTGAVAKSDADRFAAGAITAERNAARARANLDVAQEGVNVAHARRPGLPALLQIAKARVAQAKAAQSFTAGSKTHRDPCADRRRCR